MNTIFSVVIGIIIFLFLITIHEGGHFLGAKLSGIKVNEFAVGMGPTIFNKQGEETLYSLRAFPIGGYVMMEGEEKDSNDERSYNNSAAWKRFLTIFAGPFVNLLFAFLIFLLVGVFGGNPSTTIGNIQKDSPAYNAGIKEDDKIIEINNKKVRLFIDVNEQIQKSKDDLKIKVLRDNKEFDISITPKEDNGRKIIGIQPKESKGFLDNISFAFYMTIYMIKAIWNALIGLFSGALGMESLSGPVGVVQAVGTVMDVGFRALMMFVAMISVNLGFFNLLPIPALDGSKLLFILIEMIIGRPINRKFEERITIIGFMLLLALIVLITIKDVVSLF